MRTRAWICLMTLVGGTANADVISTTENSLVIESSVVTSAQPSRVYAALGKVNSWWDPQHTWSGDSGNLGLELAAGGCFCEKLAGGGSVQHGRVLYADPGKLLRLDAALGPFQEMAVTGVLTFKLVAEGDGTRITLTYKVSGAITMDTRKLAPGVDQVMAGQLNRLKAHADTL